MASFRALDGRLSRDTRDLHDLLWSPAWTGDREGLLDRLVADGRDLDAFLRVRGRLRRNVERLAGQVRRGDAKRAGESLFELIYHAHGLTAAAERVQRADFAEAGRHLEEAVGSVTIGVCANAGCFPLVTEWEAHRIDFETYMGRLEDALEAKGVASAGIWRRIASEAYRFRTSLEATAPRAERVLLARAAVVGACWATLASVSMRKTLGSPPQFPYDDVAAVVGRIAALV